MRDESDNLIFGGAPKLLGLSSGAASPASATRPRSSFRRGAIASGLARRRRWRRLRLRSSALAGSAPRSEQYVIPSLAFLALLATGASRRASTIVSAMAAVISSTERIASSLPAIGTVIRSGSELVSQIAMIGMPSLFASSTAIFSFFASTTKIRPGSPRHRLDTLEVLGELVALARHQERSFLV